MRILVVEPFHGGSHKAFLDGLGRHSRHQFTLLALPEGEWRRRMRRGAQELATAAASLTGDFELLIATDMLDLPAFLALTRPRFAHTPVLVYMHENQFTYPRLRGTKFNSWFGQINYLSALAADAVAFNSEFHRTDFLGALRTLVTQPNNWLVEGAIAAIEAKSADQPVGVELEWLDAHATPRLADPAHGPTILWNHRWEFDKAPDLFARTVTALASEGLPFRLAIAGDPGPNPSPELMALGSLPPVYLRHFGFAASAGDYARLLHEADIVVSTARHEFFGVATVEALYCGATPLAPARYNYPALVPAAHHDTCLFDTPADFAAKLRALIAGPRPAAAAFRASAARFAWPAVAPRFDTAFEHLRSRGSITDWVASNYSN
jgi:glycosyltransferase involved in cell wall biosynthesis